MSDELHDRAPQDTASSRRRAKYRRLFQDCFTPVRTVVETQLPRALLETLGPLAKTLDDRDAKRLKMVLMRDRAFVQAYLEALHPEMTAAIASFIEAHASEGAGARGLSLVGHADSEFDAAIDQCAARLRNSVDAEFTAVKLRLINLVQEPDLRDSELPFRVVVFVRAVAGGLRHIGTGEPDVIPLMRLVCSGIGRVVALAYEQIAKRLADSGASDAVPVWQATAGGSPGAARGRATGTGAAGAAGGPERTGNEIVKRDDQAQSVLMTLLERLHPGATPGAPPGKSGPSMPFAQAERISFLESRAPGSGLNFDPTLISAINDVLRATASAAAAAAGQASAAGRATASAAAAVQASAAGHEAATADLRKGLIETASRKIDKLTIELVGLLFDRIQRDRHVPAAIKEQLSRLQFPLLKVALRDPELFADAKQPARLLLDRIASTSIGWSSGGEDNLRYFEEVRSAVDSVIGSAGEASVAFEQSLQQFDRFLDEERTRDDDPVARAKRALAEAENREILAIKATMQVRSAFDGVQLESYLRDFLLDVWVRVMIEASTREKAEPGVVRRYLDAIPELVWSVQPKINPDDRKRMIGTIPSVLAILREGLNSIEWPIERIQQFFGRLMNSHANAVKALELAHSPLPQFTPSTVRIKLDGFRIPTDTSDVAAEQIKVSDDAVRHALSGSAAGVTHLSAPPQQGGSAVAMDHHQAVSAISTWSRGLWFDLHTEGQTERVVLRWISPKKALYLFTTATGDRAHSLSPDTLIAYLQSGWLVAVESAPLFDRAVDGVMFDLKHGPETAGTAP
jgi:Protein of unknown function (DUF1631)